MSDKNDSVWLKEETGLADDFSFTVERSYFGTDSRYQNGERLLLIWEGQADDPDIGEQRVWYGCGDKWATRDGKTAFHERKEGAGFNQNTPIRKMIMHIHKNLPEAFKILVSRDAVLGDKNATVWEGMRFHMKRTTIEYGAGLETRETLMPVAFLGLVSEKKAAAPAPTPAATESSPADSDRVLRNKLIVLAKKSATYEAFSTAAMDIPGVTESPLFDEVIDENGLYAKHH